MKPVKLVAAIASLMFTTAAYAADPAVSCQAGKLKASGKYASCVLAADAKGVLTNWSPDYSRCVIGITKRWTSAETKGAGMCPAGTGDQAGIQLFLDACSQSVAAALAGTNAVPPLTQLPRTGQTACYDATGAVVLCAGSGQDGELQKGVVRSFSDNGDGTITDTATGLMWEKLSDDGSIHDVDNVYDWTNAFATKLAALNSASFGGYDDWRLPNQFELYSLVNLGADDPATYSIFNTDCATACTVFTCSCTRADLHWSSSTAEGLRWLAWFVNFQPGNTGRIDKTVLAHVRAVRAGS